jgi:hypothetical protein
MPGQAIGPMSMQAAHDAQVKREEDMIHALMQTPITFCGKVVDEKGSPIAGAKATLYPADNDNTSGPGSKYERTSDGNGLFSITGIHGLGLAVDVSKEGYYQLHQSRGNFGYATGTGEMPPHRDSNNPAIFVLRKMGETEALIVAKKEVSLARDGTPGHMDFQTGNTGQGTGGDIQVAVWSTDTPGTRQRYDWRCEITVPGGGLIRRSEGFNFEAPADGYQSEETIDMPASTPNWSDLFNQEYFVQLPSGQYARIEFRLAAGGYNFFNITSYLNPTPGDRNLEYDPAKAIKAGHR